MDMMNSSDAGLVELADGVHAFIGAGGDSNSGAIRTPEGWIVLDAQQHVPLAEKFRAALEDTGPRSFLWLVLTHYHLDHTAGNSVFASDMPVLAHQITLEKFQKILGAGAGVGRGDSFTEFEKRVSFLFGPNITRLIPASDPAWDWFRSRIGEPEYATFIAAPPTHTFADRFTFHLGRRSAVLEYLGPAHCDGDIIVHLPEDGIVFVGDLLFVGRFPWLGDGDIEGWISALGRVAGLAVRQVVPGHGKPVGLKELGDFRDMLTALRDGVAEALKAGMSEDEAVERIRLADYENLPRYPEWLPWNVRNAYRSLGSA
jgi:glyoxylase-like metal-dependent hydrolase (beta-lactamase superfamily II)